MNKRKIGAEGEERAENYLLSLGFEIITRNWGIKSGEIDIIARSPESDFVFVEVKFVKSGTYGSAPFKATPSKIKQVHRVADLFLKEHNMIGKTVRVDVIAITGVKIEHFKNCF